MEEQPAIPPPAGQTSNFAHPTDVLHTMNLVTQVLCIIIVTMFVALRLWIKSCYNQSLNLEDHLTVVGWAIFIGFCTCMLILNSYGGGYNAWDVTETDFLKFQKASYATTLIYVPMVFVIKIALLAVMVKIFAPDRRKVIVIYVSIGILLCYYIPALFLKIFFCKPISAYWYGTAGGGTCIDQRNVIIADSVISIAGDLWILILPFPMIWSLHMNQAKKMRVIGILGAGGLATAFSVWRLVIIVEEGFSTNTTWFWVHCVLTANAEAGIGIICACLPAMNKFFTAVKSKSKGTSSNGYQESYEFDSRQKRSVSQKHLDSFFVPNQNDQAQLISTAIGPEQRETSVSSLHSEPRETNHEGINRNVTVSQVFEIVK